LTLAYIGDQAWPLVLNDVDWFIAHGKGKKMYFDEVRFTSRDAAIGFAEASDL
jgi:hypothetical protein